MPIGDATGLGSMVTLTVTLPGGVMGAFESGDCDVRFDPIIEQTDDFDVLAIRGPAQVVGYRIVIESNGGTLNMTQLPLDVPK